MPSQGQNFITFLEYRITVNLLFIQRWEAEYNILKVKYCTLRNCNFLFIVFHNKEKLYSQSFYGLNILRLCIVCLVTSFGFLPIFRWIRIECRLGNHPLEKIGSPYRLLINFIILLCVAVSVPDFGTKDIFIKLYQDFF